MYFVDSVFGLAAHFAHGGCLRIESGKSESRSGERYADAS